MNPHIVMRWLGAAGLVLAVGAGCGKGGGAPADATCGEVAAALIAKVRADQRVGDRVPAAFDAPYLTKLEAACKDENVTPAGRGCLVAKGRPRDCPVPQSMSVGAQHALERVTSDFGIQAGIAAAKALATPPAR
jgi:hypothetical protein